MPSPFPHPIHRSRRQALGLLGAAALPLPVGALAPVPAAGHAPQRAPADPRRGAPVFVLNSLDGTVSVIDSIKWVELRRIPTGKEPHHLYLTPDEKSVIVANAGSDSLTFIDPRTAEVQRVMTGILDPYHLRFSPDMKWFVTNANRLNHVDIYRWNGRELQLARRIATGRTPSHLNIDAGSRTVYSSMQDSDELVGIDLPTQTVLWRVPTGRLPSDIFLPPGGKHLLLGLTGGTGVELYALAADARQPPRLVKTIATAKGSHAFRAAGDGRHLYVSNRVANSISKIDYVDFVTVQTLAGPSGPDCMDVSADRSLIMVGSRWAGRLSLVDAVSGKLIHQVAVGKSPHGVWTLEHAKLA